MQGKSVNHPKAAPSFRQLQNKKIVAVDENIVLVCGSNVAPLFILKSRFL